MKIIENFDKDSGEWVYSEIFDRYYGIPNLYVNKNTLEIIQIRNKVAKCPKQSLGNNGYLRVGMYTNKGEYKKFTVHRIISFTLLPIPEKYRNLKIEDITIDHRDTNRTNNSLDNLRFCTKPENTHFRIEQGTSKLSEDHKRKIAKAGKGKTLSEEHIKRIRKSNGTPLVAICIEDGKELNAYSTIHMGELLGLAHTTIQKYIKTGKPLLSKINGKTYIIQKAPKDKADCV